MRHHIIDGVKVDFTPEEEAARDAEEAAEATRLADYTANHKYKDDRRAAYGDIGAQLDMVYWDQVNDTTTFRDHVSKVKTDHPKPT